MLSSTNARAICSGRVAVISTVAVLNIFVRELTSLIVRSSLALVIDLVLVREVGVVEVKYLGFPALSGSSVGFCNDRVEDVVHRC